MEIDLNEVAEDAILLDGFEIAIVGIVEEFGNGPRILYSKDVIIDTLCRRDEMTEEEAEEFYQFNILGLHAGNQNAVFLTTKLLPFRNPEDKMEYHLL